MEIIGGLIDATRPIEMYHIPFSLETEKVLAAPVIEICCFKNLPDPEKFEAQVNAHVEEAKKLEGEFRGLIHGWKIEEENGKEAINVVGWESVEAHTDATSKEKLKEELVKIKGDDGDFTSHHVAFRKFGG